MKRTVPKSRESSGDDACQTFRIWIQRQNRSAIVQTIQILSRVAGPRLPITQSEGGIGRAKMSSPTCCVRLSFRPSGPHRNRLTNLPNLAIAHTIARESLAHEMR